MKLKNLLLMIFVIALLVAPAGCIFSPDEKGNDDYEDNELPWASTPDILMSNFEEVYTGMLINEFTDMLHEDYQTILLSGTLEDWGWSDNFTFDKSVEVAIHTNLFGGASGVDSDGNPVHPIDSIEVDLLELQGDWDVIPLDDLDFGGYDGQWGNFEVFLHFWNADASHEYEVQQNVNFYVAPVVVEGRTKFLMLGQRGLPQEL